MSKLAEQPYFQDVAKVVSLLAREHPSLLERHGVSRDRIEEVKNNPLPLVEEVYGSFPEDLYFDLFHWDPIGCALDVLNIQDTLDVSEEITPTYRKFRSENRLHLVTFDDLAMMAVDRSSNEEVTSLDKSPLSGESLSLIETAMSLLSSKKNDFEAEFHGTDIEIASEEGFSSSTKIFYQVFIIYHREWFETHPPTYKGILISVTEGETVDVVDVDVHIASQYNEYNEINKEQSLMSTQAATKKSLIDAFKVIETIPELRTLRQRAPVLRRLRANAATKSTAD